MELLYLPAALLGAYIVVGTLLSAVKTVVLPRAEVSQLSRLHFLFMRKVFDTLTPTSQPFARRDRIFAWYAPLSLLLLPGIWVVCVLVGFTLVYWGTWDGGLWQSFETSGSSLMTLGFLKPDDPGHVTLTFVEATIGLGLVGLLISYLPTIYGAFNRREQLVAMLEGRAGTPPSAATLLTRYHRIGLLGRIDEELFPAWEAWFADVEESHTSQPALVFFRSPQPARSWLTAAGCVLDAASLVASTLDAPPAPRAMTTIRTGFFALRRIADYFGIPYDPDPAPDGPVSVTRAEFDGLCDELEAVGVPLKADRDQAWRDFAGWRVNYDAVLVQLCALVVAPPGQWSSDRDAARPRVKAIRPRRGRGR